MDQQPVTEIGYLPCYLYTQQNNCEETVPQHTFYTVGRKHQTKKSNMLHIQNGKKIHLIFTPTTQKRCQGDENCYNKVSSPEVINTPSLKDLT